MQSAMQTPSPYLKAQLIKIPLMTLHFASLSLSVLFFCPPVADADITGEDVNSYPVALSGISNSLCNTIGQSKFAPGSRLYCIPCKGYEIIPSVNSEGGSSVFWFVCHSLRLLTLGGTPLFPPLLAFCSLASATVERGVAILDGTERRARRMRLFYVNVN